jgi:hypothetical protein
VRSPSSLCFLFISSVQELRGAPKGMRVVLEKRGLWRVSTCDCCNWLARARTRGHASEHFLVLFSLCHWACAELRADCAECTKERTRGFIGTADASRTTCCAKRILALQPDFTETRSRLEEVIIARGHRCLFYPKFHCELNFIELAWGSVKRAVRERCDFTFKNNVLLCLDALPLATVRRYARLTYRWMDAYAKGLVGPLAEFAVKKFSSHRKVPAEGSALCALLSADAPITLRESLKEFAAASSASAAAVGAAAAASPAPAPPAPDVQVLGTAQSRHFVDIEGESSASALGAAAPQDSTRPAAAAAATPRQVATPIPPSSSSSSSNSSLCLSSSRSTSSSSPTSSTSSASSNSSNAKPKRSAACLGCGEQGHVLRRCPFES